MKIVVGKNSGYCFGVKRAVDCAYKELEKGKLYTYGPMAHNKQVINDLNAKGAEVVNSLDEITDYSRTLILRSHGVGKHIYDELDKRNIKYIDCTCPCVKKIHNIVNESYLNGLGIIIIGDKNHPEVEGTNGWADNKAIIAGSKEDIDKIDFLSTEYSSFVLVAQTTFNYQLYQELVNHIRGKNISFVEYNTTCDATAKSQREADMISKNVDKMIIIGDKLSSNTKKLYEISKKNCKFVVLIETIGDLQLNIFSDNDIIGITAGASTPPVTIKEVTRTMSELEKNNESFEQMLEDSFVSLHTGDVVKGKVIQVINEEVSVNLGFKSDGIIQREEFSFDPTVVPSEVVTVGDEIEVFVIRVNDGDGNVLLSRKKVEAKKGLEKIENAFNNKEVLTGKVVDIVKGGMIAVVNDIRIFIPSSQASSHYVPDLSVFKGNEMRFNIIEFDRAKRRFVGGRKELAQKELDEAKEKIFGSVQVGDIIDGTVSRITDFGAFVDLGGIDGLIHISELSWGVVKHPKDVIKEGEKVKACVLSVDKNKGKISLSLKTPDSDPWKDVASKYEAGSIISGKIVRIVPFGAFVELENGIDGLIHISQISSKHIAKADDVLSIGEIVKVKVLDINPEQKKISLSKKEADSVLASEEEAATKQEETTESPVEMEPAEITEIAPSDIEEIK